MSERKRKREKSFFDVFDFSEEASLFGREIKSTMGTEKKGSGYSMSVTYDVNDKPVVKVETYGQVDAAELRRAIQQRYPNAKIEGLEKQKLIRIVDEEKIEKQKDTKQVKKPKKKKKKPLIRIIE